MNSKVIALAEVRRARGLMSAVRAFRLAATADQPALGTFARTTERGSVGHALLASAVAQCQSDVPGAIRILERALASCSDVDRDYIVELLTPHYISIDAVERAAALIGTPLGSQNLALSRETLSAVVASRVSRESPRAGLAQEVAAEEDHLLRARWQQRLALASFWAERYDDAIELALSAEKAYTEAGSSRGLAATYSVLYAIHYMASGDIGRAFHYAGLQEASAKQSGNDSLELSSLVSRFELAAEVGDRELVATLRARLRERTVPEQYRERFSKMIAEALDAAWSGDFTTARAILEALQWGAARKHEEIRFCVALLSLVHLALGDPIPARAAARRALAHQTTKISGRSAHATRYRNLARAIAAATCILVGDTVRGRRVFATVEMGRNQGLRDLERIADGADWRTSIERTRGFARLIAEVRIAAPIVTPDVLTSTEHVVLNAIAEGKSAAEIAADLDRSIHTIRAHTRSIVAKFSVKGRVAAVAQARKLGMVP